MTKLRPDKYPCTTALLEGRTIDHWLWTQRVWLGSTRHVLELKGDKWYRWFYTSGANPKFSAIPLEQNPFDKC